MRILTAGESHGEYITAILEGFPKGVEVTEQFINRELKRRMSGFGRGERMDIEEDKVKIVSGLRNKVSLGSPITMLIKNKDARIFAQEADRLEALSIPRPAHADLSAALKYQDKDLRNFLERASARETVARVCSGAVCKQLLSEFEVNFASWTVSIGSVTSLKQPKNIKEIITKIKDSELNCLDKKEEALMVEAIQEACRNSDSLGGIFEVWCEGLCPGVGTFTHFDKRLDARLSYYFMSIPAVKGVECGLGFEYARKCGSQSHDAIYYNPQKGFFRKTNNSGGIEGGISTGEPIVFRLAMKPIATLRKPLDSVNLNTGKKEKAIVERSDTCAVLACGVIAEAMAAIAVTELFLDKFGSDSLKEIKNNYRSYLKTIKTKIL